MKTLLKFLKRELKIIIYVIPVSVISGYVGSLLHCGFYFDTNNLETEFTFAPYVILISARAFIKAVKLSFPTGIK